MALRALADYFYQKLRFPGSPRNGLTLMLRRGAEGLEHRRTGQTTWAGGLEVLEDMGLQNILAEAEVLDNYTPRCERFTGKP